MSVETEADRKLADTKKSVQEAIESLTPVVTGQCLGYDDYANRYKSDLRWCLLKLLDIKERL